MNQIDAMRAKPIHGAGITLRIYWDPRSWRLRAKTIAGKLAILDIGPVGLGIGWACNTD